MERDEILSNLLTMLVAGEDTTAHTMAWMLHFMTDVPTVQPAMQQEANAVLGAARMLPEVPAQDQFPYLDAVAQETLRLKSVAPLLFVEATQAVDFGGIDLPAGTAVFLLTRYGGLHKDACPDAGQFQPARWLTVLSTLKKYTNITGLKVTHKHRSKVCHLLLLSHNPASITASATL